MAVTIGPGWTIGAGWTIGGSSGSIPGVDNVVGYNQMPPPVTGNNIEDPSATVNGSTGFTINDSFFTLVSILGLSASNQAWFATYGLGQHTVSWGQQ